MFPAAPKIPHRHEIHGDVRLDDYFWMRERDSAPVLEYLQNENRRTNEALAPVAEFEHTLYREMRSRIKEEDSSVPVYEGGYFYYTRFAAGQEYEVHCRKKGSLEAPEEVTLDENILARECSYFEVGQIEMSPDSRYLAYAVDRVGRRIYDIFIKDLSSGRNLPDKISAVTPNFVWSADGGAIFYARQDPETLRAYQVLRYEIGGGAPQLVYEEPDSTYGVGIEASKDHNWLMISIQKRDSSEWRVLDARKAGGEWRTFLPRESEHEYTLVAGGNCFYVLTNWQARNFRLMKAPLTASRKDEWQEVRPNSAQVFIEDVDVFERFVVLNERENGLSQIRVLDRASGGDRLLQFPDAAFEVASYGLPEYTSDYLRFKYESLVSPPSVYDEVVATGERTLRKTREVCGYQPELYETKRLWAKAGDGTLVPISILYKKSLPRNGSNPCLLYGYGSYGLTTDVYFRAHALSLVDRGFIFALAHVRGGSEMGRDWYENGRLQHKMNTFTDFIVCAEKLVKDKFTSPQHLHMMGGSAGGLLMGAVMNLRPDLFKGVVAAVPFVDVLTTMLDESIPLTTGEYKEWGDPRVTEQYKAMRAYSPYDNIEKKPYPNLLVTTGYHDSQVQYWEPAKWVARLREMKTDNNHLLLYTEMQAGHSGASGRFEPLKTLAKQYVFILMLEGIRK